MTVPSITVPVLRLHIVALDRREMTAPVGGRVTGGSRTITFIRRHRALCGTHMTKALRIGQISRGGGHFVDEARIAYRH